VGFYTYLWLREDGTPYYVGKGQGKRAFRKSSPNRDRIVIQEFPDEDSAFFAEKLLIAFYGRKDNGTGVLRNLSDGGEGPVGYIMPPQRRAKLASFQNAKWKKIMRANMKDVQSRQKRPCLTARHQGSGPNKSNHTRWHVKRGIVKPDCNFC
jgi:hypothetical protein